MGKIILARPLKPGQVFECGIVKSAVEETENPSTLASLFQARRQHFLALQKVGDQFKAEL
ncbi:hypothetical protein Cflav_PD4826 [Pedosphaera parvula Ellin514]|uniref:Uncharacterized protein n=1 Tax=Pedosphaera parvula (strain Ellin514) TaxID=320771 RepID=B9XES2_PEDPL|nr:hypothetical protein Cflav_PD4826 [Pedosphaera parvula Ellin514]